VVGGRGSGFKKGNRRSFALLRMTEDGLGPCDPTLKFAAMRRSLGWGTPHRSVCVEKKQMRGLQLLVRLRSRSLRITSVKGVVRRSSSFAARLILETLFERDAERQGDLERGLKRWGIFVLLHGDDGLARDADLIGELLLGQVTRGAQLANAIAYGGH
jgi:hypothetical protein